MQTMEAMTQITKSEQMVPKIDKGFNYYKNSIKNNDKKI